MEGDKAIPNKKINWCYMVLTYETGKIDYQTFFFLFLLTFSFYTSLVISAWKWLFLCFYHKCEWTSRCFINAYRNQHYNSIYSSTDSISLKSSVKEVTDRPEALPPYTFPTACGNKFFYIKSLESPKKSYYSNFVQGGEEKGGKNAFD